MADYRLIRVFLVLAALLSSSMTHAASSVLLLELEGVIGPASKDFVLRGLNQARDQGADLVVLRMNTPGGLDSSMRDIIKAILSSPVPVASYVAPGGARAASAGTYILYASHIAAMAPATNLGAATPVQVGGGMPVPGSRDNEDDSGDGGNEKDDRETSDPSENRKPSGGKTAMERKIINDARAYIRSLAQLRKRNVEWAEKAVIDADSLSAEEALDDNVIDIVAANVADLLQQIDGRSVEVRGQNRALALSEPVIETLAPDWRNRILAVITNPQVAYILMLLGIYGLFFELSNPGALIPGVLGGICLLLALFAFQVLPINYAGLALLVLGLMFMIAEAFMPSFGIMGIGGVIAFIVGSLMLWDEEVTGYELPLALILGLAAASAVVFLLLGAMVIRSRRRKPVTGDAAIVGGSAIALEDFIGKGYVQFQGERWQARCDQPVKIQQGQTLTIGARDGLILEVHPEETP